MRPFVSVLIDTYNHERFIEQAITSVLEQDFPASEMEVLVVDDGSTDRTPDVLRQFEPRVRVIRKANGGQASAFNTGIPQCRGELIAFLDGDDWWATAKLREVVNSLDKNRELGLVGHGITEVHSDGSRITECPKITERLQANTKEGAKTFRLRKSFFGTSRLAVRTELLRRIGAVPESLTIEADEYLFTLGAVLSECLILAGALTFYRLHGANAFQITDGNAKAMERKQRILEFLSSALTLKLREVGLSADVAKIITDWVALEAKILRLQRKGGSPWETFAAEMEDFHVRHADTPLWRRALKTMSLAPACVLPPRIYFDLRGRLAGMASYRKVRERFLPFAQPSHVERHRTGH